MKQVKGNSAAFSQQPTTKTTTKQNMNTEQHISTSALLDSAMDQLNIIDAEIDAMENIDLVRAQDNISQLVTRHTTARVKQIMLNASLDVAQIEVDRIKAEIDRLFTRRSWTAADTDRYKNITATIESMEITELIPAEDSVHKLNAQFIAETTTQTNLARQITDAEDREQHIMDEIKLLFQQRSTVASRIDDLALLL